LVIGIGVICGASDSGCGEGADYIGDILPIGTGSAEGCPIGERTNRFLDVTRAARSPPGLRRLVISSPTVVHADNTIDFAPLRTIGINACPPGQMTIHVGGCSNQFFTEAISN